MKRMRGCGSTFGLALALVALMSTSAAALPPEVILASNFVTGERVALAPDGSSLSTLRCGGDLTRGPGSPRWFVDAKTVSGAYPTPHTQLVAHDEDCTVEIQLTSDENMERVAPRWSPDGLRVAYGSERFDPNNGQTLERGIFVADVVRDALTGAPAFVARERLMVPLPSEQVIVSWAGDSCRLTYASESSGQSDIFVANVCGLQATSTNVTTTPTLSEFGPAFHPTADRIAFARRIEKGTLVRLDIFVLDLTAARTVQVTNKNNANLEQIGRPAWSPSGNYLAFDGMGIGSGRRDIYKIATDGGGKAVNLTGRYAGAFVGPIWR